MENTILKDLAGNILDPKIPRYEVEDSGWINIEPLIGTKSTGYYAPQYRKIGNIVYLSGVINGITQRASTIFTLPEGFRPKNKRFDFCITNSHSDVIMLRITNAGYVLIQSSSVDVSTGVDIYFNISFPVD